MLRRRDRSSLESRGQGKGGRTVGTKFVANKPSIFFARALMPRAHSEVGREELWLDEKTKSPRRPLRKTGETTIHMRGWNNALQCLKAGFKDSKESEKEEFSKAA